MHRISTSYLRELEVINLCSGEKLGYICDFEIDIDDARILSIIVQRESVGFALFSSKEQLTIPWCYIECIGEDTVLVQFDEPQRAITAGQAVVFYDGDTLVGGATILP